MITENEHEPIEQSTGPDDIIDTQIDEADAKKDVVQEKLEGSEPSKEETEIDEADSKLSRSE